MRVYDKLSDAAAPDHVVFGPFSLERRLATGGTAEVFLARPMSEPSAAPVVVKRLLPSLRARGDVDILHREAELHRLVSHPNVVRVLEGGEVDGEPYIAMELVDGLDLYRLLKRCSSSHQAIPAAIAVYVARSIADALHAVHTADDNAGGFVLIHGDVSPSNIYLASDGRVKLGDFGLARLATQKEQDESERAAGHFGYLAPEQLSGEAQDHRVDVFALGAVLGELLCGRRVFPGAGQLAVMLSIRDGNIAPLRAAKDKLPHGLFEICERALMRDPARRHQSALEFSQALRAFEQPNTDALQEALSSWVVWAQNDTRFARNLERRVRESVNMMKAVSRNSSGVNALEDLEESAPSTKTTEHSQVRWASTGQVESVPFSKLLEMVATGEIELSDEVALCGAPFQPVEKIEELAQHLVPSTSQTTSRMFGSTVPDFVVDFSQVSMLQVLGKVYNEKLTCSLFVTQSMKRREQRKDVYVRDGRLLHVTSTDPDELLGRYLVHQGAVTEAQLEEALSHLAKSHKQLGEVLIGLGMVDAVEVFTALRNQGRDRMAALCGWKRGSVQLYQGAAPERMLFPLDLDLTLCMMAGAYRNQLVPPERARLVLGPNAPAPGQNAACIPLLNLVPMVARKRMSTGQALAELTPLTKRRSEDEVKAVLVVAEALDWLRFA